MTTLMLYQSVHRFRIAEAPLLLLSSRPLSNRPTDCEPFAASAVRQIQTEVILRRVFQHCCGHSCQIEAYVFPIRFSSFLPHLQVRCHRLDQFKLRPQSESRKRKMMHLSTMGPIGGG